MLRRILFPGSFDPMTLGHLDLLQRALPLCDELVVAVLHNPAKQGLFSPPERAAQIERITAPWARVRVVVSDRLLVDVARQEGARVILRGLRTSAESAVEIQMAQLNRALDPNLEVLMMVTAPQYAFVSSSFVREIASKEGDISAFVPGEIIPEIRHKFQKA